MASHSILCAVCTLCFLLPLFSFLGLTCTTALADHSISIHSNFNSLSVSSSLFQWACQPVPLLLCPDRQCRVCFPTLTFPFSLPLGREVQLGNLRDCRQDPTTCFIHHIAYLHRGVSSIEQELAGSERTKSILFPCEHSSHPFRAMHEVPPVTPSVTLQGIAPLCYVNCLAVPLLRYL